VYAARRVTSEGTELAVLQHFRAANAGDAAGILRDAGVISALTHPNLARVHRAERLGDEIVVLSEFVEGESFAELQALAVAKGTTIPLEIQLRIILATLAGTGALHDKSEARERSKGLYHGLLSPTQVLVGLDGVTRIIGLLHALPLRVSEEAAVETSYFAPEVLAGDGRVDKRADVYSVGVFLLEALSGQRLAPLHVVGEDGKVRHVTNHPARPTLAKEHAWATPLVDVALRALSTEPAARYQSAGEMIVDMQSCAKLVSQAEVAALVRELAGESIRKRRSELRASLPSRTSFVDDELTDISPQSGIEKREDTDTFTSTATAPVSTSSPGKPPSKPHEDEDEEADDAETVALGRPPVRLTPPPHSVVNVDVAQEGAYNDTLHAAIMPRALAGMKLGPPEVHDLPAAEARAALLSQSQVFVSPPSYVRLGTAITLAFLAALALLIFVIVRAVSGEDGQLDTTEDEARTKAEHHHTVDAVPEQVSPGTKRLVAPPPPTVSAPPTPPPAPPRRPKNPRRH
jgi:serine/threonine-protein kinase